jgi:hypothetical protein
MGRVAPGRAWGWFAACCAILLAALLLVAPSASAQTAYEAPLPAEINRAPALCDHVPCREVLPGATVFSERKGQPRYVEGFAEANGHRTLVGYVMLSTDITDTPAYSGKPVITLIGMDTRGRFTGVKILKHSEPILLLGIPESALIRFNEQYLGKFVGDHIEIGQLAPRGEHHRPRRHLRRHRHRHHPEPGDDDLGCRRRPPGRHPRSASPPAGALRRCRAPARLGDAGERRRRPAADREARAGRPRARRRSPSSTSGTAI